MPPKIFKMQKDDAAPEFETDITIHPSTLTHEPIYPKDPGPIVPESEEKRYIDLVEQKLILVSQPLIGKLCGND